MGRWTRRARTSGEAWFRILHIEPSESGVEFGATWTVEPVPG
jgi:hypothetical protein